MRKMEGRLATGGASGASQATPFQKVFLLGLTLNSVGLLVAPDSKVLAVIEIVLWVVVLAESWVHFIAFERTSNDTLGRVEIIRFHPVQLVGHQPGVRRKTLAEKVSSSLKRVRGAKKNIGRNMGMLFIFCHLAFVGALCYNPLCPDNVLLSGECQVCLV
jgi:hypothetical protein